LGLIFAAQADAASIAARGRIAAPRSCAETTVQGVEGQLAAPQRGRDGQTRAIFAMLRLYSTLIPAD